MSVVVQDARVTTAPLVSSSELKGCGPLIVTVVPSTTISCPS